ncbi:MAG: type II toxin-antitoxin system death-on-curing family toxin [Janthinobacterium lividum]
MISNHVFTDGNKRTGLDVCLLFLEFNGYQLNNSVNNPILTDE